MLRDARIRAIVIQALGLAIFIGVVAMAGATAWQRMRQQGIAVGFDVLLRPTGFTIGSLFLAQAAGDPYWWTLLAAFANTVFVGLLCITLSLLAGFAIGIGLLAENWIVAAMCGVYVNIFRNIPLVLQAIFWYVTFTLLPNPRANPPSLFGLAFFSNKGLALPIVEIIPGQEMQAFFICAGLLAALGILLASRFAGMMQSRILFAAGLIVVAVLLGASRGLPVIISWPALQGFDFRGGVAVPLELIALTVAIVVFSAAYIAEIIRGGVQSVPKGQTEAAMSLGLPGWVIFLKITFPIALRSIIPPLGNQLIFVMKSTALGIAVGYSDIFSVSIVSISQTGQAVEFLLMMMLIYFVLNYSITLLVNWLNHALAFAGGRT